MNIKLPARWAHGIGYMMAGSSMMCIPGYAIWLWNKTEGTAKEVRTTVLQCVTPVLLIKTEKKRVSPVDRRPSTAEAPPIGKIHPFSKIAVTLEPIM